MVAFRNSDPSGRTSGLLLRCVLYSLLALGLIIVDKRYDHLGKIRRWLSIVAYPVQVAVENRAGAQHHEQHHPALAAMIRVTLFDRHRISYLGDPAKRGVHLAGADADAVDVEDTVGAAVHAGRPVRVEFHQIAVGPDACVVGKVGRVEAAAVGIAQEADRP